MSELWLYCGDYIKYGNFMHGDNFGDLRVCKLPDCEDLPGRPINVRRWVSSACVYFPSEARGAVHSFLQSFIPSIFHSSFLQSFIPLIFHSFDCANSSTLYEILCTDDASGTSESRRHLASYGYVDANMTMQFGPMLIFLAVSILITGIVFAFAPNWRLPGDMSFSVGNMQFYFPLATSLLLSIILTIGVNLLMAQNRR